MYRLREWGVRLLGYLGRRQREADLDREIAAHLQMAIDERVQQGMAPGAAHRAALVDLGGLVQTREAFRQQHGVPWIEEATRDFRYGLRMLRARPAFATAIVLAIALGVGANAAVFTVAYNVLWRPLPFHEPDRLLRLYHAKGQDMRMPVSPLNYLDWAKLLNTVEATAAWRGSTFELIGPDGKEMVPGVQVTASVFQVLRVQPSLGRVFLEQEDEPSGQRVAMISDRFWRARFGANADAVGRSLTAGGVVYTIVGVFPAGVAFPTEDTAIWTPLRIGDSSHRMRRTENYLNVIARLKPGISRDAAQLDADRVARVLAAEYPTSNTGTDIAVRSLHDIVTGAARAPLQLLMGTALMVLLISCANVAHLLLSRMQDREGELTLRAALGATRARLLRQSAIETLLLAAGGGALGLLAAAAGVAILRASLPASLPRRHEIDFNLAIVLYGLACTALVWVVAAAAPAWRGWRANLNQSLQAWGKASSRRLGVVGRAAVVVQVMLCAVLLIAALLMVQSLRNVLSADAGFSARDILVTAVAAPPAAAGSGAAGAHVVEHFETLVEEVVRLTGVKAAGLVNHLPLGGESSGTRFTIEHRTSGPHDVHMAAYRVVSPTYFSTIGARLLHGRQFSASDRPDAAPVFIINETMAKRHWGDQHPVGIRIRRGGTDSKMPYATIVGVVADMKQDALDRQANPEIFIPHAQFPWPTMSLVVRTSRPLEAIGADLRAVLTRVGRTSFLDSIRAYDDVVVGTVKEREFTSNVLLLLTVLAAIVATLGIYAVAGHVAAAKTRELAIRYALGASAPAVAHAAVGQTVRLVAIGLALGMLGAYAVARTMSATLFGIAAFDPFTYSAALASLGGIAALAAAVPARRALALDPVATLRAD